MLVPVIQANRIAGIAMMTPPCGEKKPLGITSEASSTMHCARYTLRRAQVAHVVGRGKRCEALG